MRVCFSLRAARQFENALDHIASESPRGAFNVRERLYEVTAMLAEYPFAGGSTTKQGVRRFVIRPYPYFIDYSVRDDEVFVRRFRHAARKPIP